MKRHIKQLIKIAVIAGLLPFFCITIVAADNDIPKRWLFISSGLGNDEELARLKSLIIRAKDNNFNGILFDSSILDTIDIQSESKRGRLLLLKKICDLNGMELIPRMFSIGYAGSLISNDNNLAAAYPVKQQSFVAKNGFALPISSPTNEIVKIDFENIRNNKLIDFYLQDLPGQISIIDTTNKFSGSASIKLHNFTSNAYMHGRLGKIISLASYKSYEASCWVKSTNWPVNTPVNLLISSADGYRRLAWKSIKPTNEWQKLSIEFNSIDNSQVRLAVGVWGGSTGQVWIDDIQVKLADKINRLVKHAGAPFVLKNAADDTTYMEGKDYTIDKTSTDLYEIKIKSRGRIRNNDLLNASYYRSYIMGEWQICANMALPNLALRRQKQLSIINTLIKPNIFFLAADEIRQGGYCELSQSKCMSKIFGDYITGQFEMIKNLVPSAQVLISGDMLDPNLNAVKNYYMTRGGFERSWLNVPKMIIPSVWDYNKRDQSLSHFQDNDFRVVVNINVDETGSINGLQKWKTSINRTQTPFAITYVTWIKDYSKIETFKNVIF